MLTINNVTLTIGQVTLCRELSITIRAGDVWGMLGPNGCGKTTLLHGLCGLHAPTLGDITLAETTLAALSAKSIARSIGLLFQDFTAAFPQTVWEYCLAGRFPHLAYFKSESADDKLIVTQALQTMELTHLARRSIMALSGGEKRRLSIAALLTQSPLLYLLDEPTNHLDVRHQHQVLRHFQALALKGAGVVMSLHDVNLAERYCNKLLLLFPDGRHVQGEVGKVLTEGNLAELYQCSMVRGAGWSYS
jgi:iron complex transport system ATP-binding protein